MKLFSCKCLHVKVNVDKFTWSCFNVNFNLNFDIFFKTTH